MFSFKRIGRLVLGVLRKRRTDRKAHIGARAVDCSSLSVFSGPNLADVSIQSMYSYNASIMLHLDFLFSSTCTWRLAAGGHTLTSVCSLHDNASGGTGGPSGRSEVGTSLTDIWMSAQYLSEGGVVLTLGNRFGWFTKIVLNSPVRALAH